MSQRTWAASSVLIAVCLALLTPAEAWAWEVLFEEEGIKVWKKEIEGSDFVAFRGRGVIKANIIEVAAVIRDASRNTEWMKNCVDAKTVRLLTAVDAIAYNRTGSPVPLISDRDTVLKVETKVARDKKMIWVVFNQIEDPKAPVIDGVVRMPVLKGHWRLRQISTNETELEYQVQADPGGALPAWLVNLVSRKMPYHTVLNMRTQVKKRGYDSHQNILAAAVDWSGFELPAKFAPEPTTTSTQAANDSR